jgi:hypothetical protein
MLATSKCLQGGSEENKISQLKIKHDKHVKASAVPE